VRILILSDIHANLEALEACLEAAPSYDRVVNLGDVVGYGASPNEVIEQSRKLGGPIVRGNHDKACSGVTSIDGFNPVAGMAVLWTRTMLARENLHWLHELPQGPLTLEDVPNVQFVHGSPLDEDEYLINLVEALEPLEETEIPLTFFGHTHIQGGFLLNGEDAAVLRPVYKAPKSKEEFELKLKKEPKYLINPGSVGQPRDNDWRAAFAVYDNDARIVTYCRVPYDVEAAQERIIQAELPERLAARLAHGR